MKLLSFQLTMPNVGSWNGKWSQADKKFFIIRKLTDRFINQGSHLKQIIENRVENFHYSFGDGWGANVRVEVVDSSEAAKRRKVSSGFCGYDWMIDNIIYNGSPEKDIKHEENI